MRNARRSGDNRCAAIHEARFRVYSRPFASIAARTFGGDIGSSVSRVPTARSIALAIAAIGGQMLTSAAPLAPYGWLGFATSTITGSIIGRSDDTGMR